jgi:hypothetical protein
MYFSGTLVDALSAPSVQRPHVCSPASKLWIYATEMPMTKSRKRVALMPTCFGRSPELLHCFLAVEIDRAIAAGAVTERANDVTRRRRWGRKLSLDLQFSYCKEIRLHVNFIHDEYLGNC